MTARIEAEKKPVHHVLVVDDHEPIRNLLAKLLEMQGFVCTLAASAEEAERHLRERPFELILSDVNMPPGRSGIDLVKRVAARFPNTATILVTAEDNPATAELAVNLGAYGYVIKPFKANELMINISNAMHRRRLEIENRAHREILENTVAERTVELRQALSQLQVAERALRVAHEETVNRLMRAAEFRDNETAQHIQRMGRYCELLAAAAGMGEERCGLIRQSTPMHDIGKIGIPDQILLKPGPLTAEERVIMCQHSEIGFRILNGTGVPLLDLSATIALTHHEKYNGTGYPRGLKGETIPIEGRITAVADVFDALTSRRVYKPAYPLEEAADRVRSQRGEHFDPRLADLLCDNLDAVREIKRQYPDD